MKFMKNAGNSKYIKSKNDFEVSQIENQCNVENDEVELLIDN